MKDEYYDIKNANRTPALLKEMQALPLDEKIEISIERAREWYEHWEGEVYVSFSGGKDSTALLHLIRSEWPEVPAVFVNTGLELPEVREFVDTVENSIILKPNMTFLEVILQYGYPVISKEVSETIDWARRRGGGKTTIKKRQELLGTAQFNGEKSKFNKEKWMQLAQTSFKISNVCCATMKKSPIHKFQRTTGLHSYIGTLADESRSRLSAWLKTGCNTYAQTSEHSAPLSFWTDSDIFEYLHKNNLKIADVYGDIIYKHDKYQTTGADRTGCTFCGFGAHFEKRTNSRFRRLKQTHPKLWDYCMLGGEWIENPDYDPTITREPDSLGWIEWNPKRLWIPNKTGLGMGYVFDTINRLYGEGTVIYE